MNASQIKSPAGAGMRELTRAEHTQVSGGMKWQRGVVSADVIDVRGGTYNIGGWTLGFDVHGNLSSVTVN